MSVLRLFFCALCRGTVKASSPLAQQSHDLVAQWGRAKRFKGLGDSFLDLLDHLDCQLVRRRQVWLSRISPLLLPIAYLFGASIWMNYRLRVLQPYGPRCCCGPAVAILQT